MTLPDDPPMRMSSRLTFLFRTAFPAGWLLLLVLVASMDVPAQLEPHRRFMLAGLALLLAQSAAWFVRLRDVRTDADGLVISNGRVEARVSWTQVAAIERPWWGKGHFARLRLRTVTKLGSAVLFMLPLAPFTRWSEHPSVRLIAERTTPPAR
jgi:hypothetical protein